MTDRWSALWVSEEVEALTGGQSSQPWQATDLTICAKDVRPGDVFFASIGDDLKAVFEQGATAAVVSRAQRVPDDIKNNYPITIVPCAYEALRTLARAARERTSSVVVAVQGFDQRKTFSRAIGAVADYYEGGRHLSSAMAAMPQSCDFSVFSLSPSLQPDIAIIDRPSLLRSGGLFENMPNGGVVLLNVDDPAYIDILGLARGAGVANVLTYSAHNAQAECAINAAVQNAEGTQVTATILGEQIVTHIPQSDNASVPPLGMMVAAMCVAKLSDMRIKQAAWAIGQVYAAPKKTHQHCEQEGVQKGLHRAENISFVGAKAMEEEAIFKVRNLVDTGAGRRTVILDQAAPQAKEQDFTMPTRFGELDVVCASKKVSIFKNARKAVENLMRGVKLHRIIPAVLTPGDYVVFKSKSDKPSAEFTESYRASNM